jgi:uncharacterized membrane protein YkvA (DUF1232 family)
LAILQRLGLHKLLRLVFHLPNFGKLFFRLMKDPRVSLPTKMIPLALLGYLVIPIDLLPDFFPGLGQIDDVMVIFLGLRLFLKFCPKKVVQEHVTSIAAGN